MSIKSTLAFTFAMTVAAGPLFAQNGVLGGKATDKAKQPYENYDIRLRSASARNIVQTVKLDAQGQFNFQNVALTQPFLVELFDTKGNKVVCTEGPFTLTPALTSKTDVNIDCGKNPTAWILAGAAAAALGGVAATQGNDGGTVQGLSVNTTSTQSPSQ